MKAAIYSSTVIKKEETKELPCYNASAFPSHSSDIEIIYLNGKYPEIETLCKEQGLKVLPLSELKKSQRNKSKEMRKQNG